MTQENRTPIEPVGTLPLPGDTVRQVMPAPIVGVVSPTTPLQVDQRTGKVQFLVEWTEDGPDGPITSSTWFEANDVEILDRAERDD